MAPAFATSALALGTTALHGARVCSAPTAPSAPARARVRMAFTSIGGVLTEPPVSMPCEAEVVLAAAYRQVLGNAHVMESEREELGNAESSFKRNGDVKAFVRAVALSDTYRARFVEPNSAFRTVELLFKHLLARGPSSLREYAEVMRAMQTGGFESAVDWFVMSAEYDEVFGDYTVPYPVFRGAYPTNEEFNRAVALRGTPCSSDKKRSTVLQYAVCSGDSPSWLTIAKGLPAGTERGTGFSSAGRWASTKRNKASLARVGTKIPGGVVFY